MIYECCSKDKIRFEIESWYENLTDNERLVIEITKCEVLEGAFDLKINKCFFERKTALEDKDANN